MACNKYRIPCNECQFKSTQDNCPGANYWNELCDKPLVEEIKITNETEKKKFGKLFCSLQKFIPEFNMEALSSNKVSLLKRKEKIALLKAIRHKEKDLVDKDYVNLNNENISKLLYITMIRIHERG